MEIDGKEEPILKRIRSTISDCPCNHTTRGEVQLYMHPHNAWVGSMPIVFLLMMKGKGTLKQTSAVYIWRKEASVSSVSRKHLYQASICINHLSK
jgi:hypothetical protein